MHGAGLPGVALAARRQCYLPVVVLFALPSRPMFEKLKFVMTITDALVAEHFIYLGVFDEIERSLPTLASPAELRTMASLIERILAPHAATENNLAYLVLDHVLAEEGHLERMHHEHQEIDSRLRKVHATENCAEARRLLKAAIVASREHFRLEERDVFPLIENTLKRETLEELGQSWLRDKTEAAAAA